MSAPTEQEAPRGRRRIWVSGDLIRAWVNGDTSGGVRQRSNLPEDFRYEGLYSSTAVGITIVLSSTEWAGTDTVEMDPPTYEPVRTDTDG